MITRLGLLGKRLDKVLNHEDLIIHTGSFQGESKSLEDPTRFLKNIENTFKYLELARQEKKKFVYISTWDHHLNPYTESKRTCERMIMKWHCIFKVNYLIIAIPSILETVHNKRGIIYSFLNAEVKPIIKNRDVELLTLDEVVRYIKENIFDVSNGYLRLEGRKVEVQLLYDLITVIKGVK